MNKTKILKNGLIATTAIISLFSFGNNLKSIASTDCTQISDKNVKYVNATFVDIQPEWYNQRIREMSSEVYYPKPMQERENIDKQGIYFGSTEGRVVGGIQNGFIGTNVPNNCHGVIQGLVENKLVNGNLKVVNKYKNGTTLFPDTFVADHGYDEILANYKMPFLKNENGYYSFNSDEYHLCRDDANKRFTLHKGARNGFYPFNQCSDDTAIEGNRNLFFTVKMEIPFYMTSDGKVKNTKTGQSEDMVFNFSGDDDVWIFVDDTLVVDLGGPHIKQTGNINFATNQVYYSSVYNAQAARDDSDVYKTAFQSGKLSQGDHTLKIFYMERAGGISNLFATFNLQSSSVETKYVEKYTNKQLASKTQTGVIGQTVELEEKQFPDKVLCERPKETTVTLTEEPQTFYFYYKNKYNLTADYLDFYSHNKIADSTSEKVTEDDPYTTENKTIEDYILVEVPSNASGIMPHNDVNVQYYYKHKGKITVNYVDKATQDLLDKNEFNGVEGDKVTSEQKNFDNYVFFSGPETNEHTIDRDEQVINYYYVHQSKIIVNYIDKDTNERLDRIEETVSEGTIYELDEKAFPYYRLVERPDYSNILIGREDIEVNFYYQKLKFNLKVEMNLKEAIINETHHELKNKIGKVELNLNEANSNSSSKIHFIVRVTNDQEREGAGRLLDYIPEGYMALQEDNPLWTISSDTMYIDLGNMNPGETREYEVILTKKEGVDVSGTIKNKVSVNSIDVEETTLEDNEDTNEVVIMPRTGVKKVAIVIACIMIGLIIAAIKIKAMFR